MRRLEDSDYRGTQGAKMGDGSNWFRIPRIPKEAKVYDLLSEYSHTVTEEKYRILDHDSRIPCRDSNRQFSY
jgi:hypothetical protein